MHQQMRVSSFVGAEFFVVLRLSLTAENGGVRGRARVSSQMPSSEDSFHASAVSQAPPSPSDLHTKVALSTAQCVAGLVALGATEMRVLVTDDVSSNRKMLCRILRNRLTEEFRGTPVVVVIEEVEDGHLSVNAVFGEYPSRLHKYDVITMDAQMPVLDGFAATKMLRAAGFVGKIYGVTGNSMVTCCPNFLFFH